MNNEKKTANNVPQIPYDSWRRNGSKEKNKRYSCLQFLLINDIRRVINWKIVEIFIFCFENNSIILSKHTNFFFFA